MRIVFGATAFFVFGAMNVWVNDGDFEVDAVEFDVPGVVVPGVDVSGVVVPGVDVPGVVVPGVDVPGVVVPGVDVSGVVVPGVDVEDAPLELSGVVTGSGVTELGGGGCEITKVAVVDDPLNPGESAVSAATTQLPVAVNERTGEVGLATEQPLDPLF